MTLYSDFECQRVRAQQVAMAARLVAEWNAACPVGTAVTVTRDDGTVEHTRTRSEAWQLANGDPLVLVEGISGGYTWYTLFRVQKNGGICCDVLDHPSGGNEHTVSKQV